MLLWAPGLIAIALLQIPSAVRNHHDNRCIDAQIQLRQAPQAAGQDSPGMLCSPAGDAE